MGWMVLSEARCRRRPCGKTGLNLTAIGFGAMRIHGKDIEAGAQVVRRAAMAGFNYFETSERYCSSTSEAKVGKGLKGLRDGVVISTKSRAAGQSDGRCRADARSIRVSSGWRRTISTSTSCGTPNSPSSRISPPSRAARWKASERRWGRGSSGTSASRRTIRLRT